MGAYVSVESFEALQRLRVALCRFAEVAGAGLDEADAELQRMRDWVKVEQSGYWKREAEKRAELLTRAKGALTRKKLMPTALGGRPSCAEEEKEVARATQRVEEARQKMVNVRRWSRQLDNEILTYQAVASGLSQALAGDVPNALAQLDNMLAALEAYATADAPQVQGSVATGGVAELESVARVDIRGSDEVDWLLRLRAQTPSQDVRDTVAVAEPNESWRCGGATETTWSAELGGLRVARVPVVGTDKIILARQAGPVRRIYFERRPATSAGDSGWYVGAVDADTLPEYDALRVADFLALRPELVPLLELPPGSLVVVDNAVLEAVFDGEQNRLWPAAAAGPVRPADRREPA